MKIPDPHIGSIVIITSEYDESSSTLNVLRPVHVTALTARKKQSLNSKC